MNAPEFRFIGFTEIPTVERQIIHQVDVARTSPGGIDTCIRGLCKYASPKTAIAVIGVDTGDGPDGRRLGKWECYATERGAEIYFMPVARFDPAVMSSRRIPHSLRLALGVVRYRARWACTSLLQAHRADVAVVVALSALTRPFTYFIHTQRQGITSSTTDSLWKRMSKAHVTLESFAIRHADTVVVFNPDYAVQVRDVNPRTIASTTWYDPDNFGVDERDIPVAERQNRIVWVGRLEQPKDPLLVLEAFAELLNDREYSEWTLDVIGSGGLRKELDDWLSGCEPSVSKQVNIVGRLSHREVGESLRSARVFAMTSFPGYEGFPRVLVEAMASGAIPVVTAGSDTGGLITDGKNGKICDVRDPAELARAIKKATVIPSCSAVAAALELSAPEVVNKILGFTVVR